MTFKCQRSKQHRADQNRIHQVDFLVISEHTSWKSLLLVGRGKKVPCKTV